MLIYYIDLLMRGNVERAKNINIFYYTCRLPRPREEELTVSTFSHYMF